MEQHNASTKNLKPILYMVVAMAMWAIIEQIPRYFSQQYTSYQIVWMRYSVHLAFMALVFGPRFRLRLVRTQRLPQQILRGMLMLGMHLCFIFAIKSISYNTTMAGFWVAPLVLLGLSTLLGEKPGALQWGISAVVFACVLFTLRPLGSILQPASLLSLGMAVCFAIYMQMTRAMTGEDILASLFYTAFSVWLLLSFLMPFYWVAPTWTDLLLFAAIGLLGLVCILGFDKAAELAPTWVSAPFTMVQQVLVLSLNLVTRAINPGRLSLAATGIIMVCFAFLSFGTSPIQRIRGYLHV